MEIDLFTLVAQIINLIILLFLLRKFLYLPVLKAVTARQQTIADEMSAAEEARKSAQRAEDRSRKQLQKMEAQRQKILLKANDEAEQLSAELNAKAYAEYRQVQEQWRNRMIAEQNNFEITMQKAVTEQFHKFAAKALAQIADAEVNALAVKKLMAEMDKQTPEAVKEYAAAFIKAGTINIISAADLADELRAKLEAYLRSSWNLPTKVQFIYSVKPELLCGLSIEAGEQLVAWNFEEYLREFKQNLNKTAQQFLNRGEK